MSNTFDAGDFRPRCVTIYEKNRPMFRMEQRAMHKLLKEGSDYESEDLPRQFSQVVYRGI